MKRLLFLAACSQALPVLFSLSRATYDENGEQTISKVLCKQDLSGKFCCIRSEDERAAFFERQSFCPFVDDKEDETNPNEDLTQLISSANSDVSYSSSYPSSYSSSSSSIASRMSKSWPSSEEDSSYSSSLVLPADKTPPTLLQKSLACLIMFLVLVLALSPILCIVAISTSFLRFAVQSRQQQPCQAEQADLPPPYSQISKPFDPII